MISSPGAGGRDRAVGFLDGLQSFGLVILLFGLPFSEAMKSIGLAIAVLGFTGKLVCGTRPHMPGRAAAVALLAYVAAAALSIVAAEPGLRRPGELFTLGMTVVPFILVADACARRTRGLLFAVAVVSGAALASVLAYVSYMQGPYLRLVLGSIENAVPSAEYLGTALALAVAMLVEEFASTLAGPLWAFAAGSSGLALLMTKSRGPLLGALVGLVVTVATALRRRRYAFVIAAAAVAAILLFAAANPGARLSGALSPRSRSVGIRTAVWSETMDLVLDRPVSGHGLGSYGQLGVIYSDERGDLHQMNAHNTWLHTACETGVLGAGTLAVFMVLGLVGVVRACRLTRGLERAVSVGALGGVVVLLVEGVFSVTTDAEPGMLFFSLMALGSAGAPRGRGGRGRHRTDEN